MGSLVDWRFFIITFLGSAILALMCLVDPITQFRAVRLLGGAGLIGACVAYTLLMKPSSFRQYKRAVVTAAFVGILAAIIYFLAMVVILSLRDSVEVITSKESSLLMLRLAVLLTLSSSAGGSIITVILKTVRSREKGA